MRADECGKKWYSLQFDGVSTASTVESELDLLKRVFQSEQTEFDIVEDNTSWVKCYFLMNNVIYAKKFYRIIEMLLSKVLNAAGQAPPPLKRATTTLAPGPPHLVPR